MTLSERNTFILDMQCQHSAFSDKYLNTLSLGDCPSSFADIAIETKYLLKPWYRYTPYTTEVFTSWQIEFTQVTKDVAYTVEVEFQAINFGTYSGSSDGESVALFFETAINLLTSSHNISAERVGNILYFYSYDNTYNYLTDPVVTILPVTDPVVASAVITSLEDSSETILDLWNCLTLEELCGIKTYTLSILNT